MTKTREASNLINDVYSDFTSNNVGIGTTNPTSKLTVVGDVRISGILTVGSSSITIDGNNNAIRVGTGVTITTGGITVNGTAVGGVNTADVIAYAIALG